MTRRDAEDIFYGRYWKDKHRDWRLTSYIYFPTVRIA